MEQALVLAKAAAEAGEVPVGAVLVDPDGQVAASASNRTETDQDPTAHAEILAIRQGAKLLGAPRLEGFSLYVTLEPCAMCAAAISFARLAAVYYGAYDPKGGGVDHGPRFFQQPTCHHAPQVFGGLMETDCRSLLQSFFQSRR